MLFSAEELRSASASLPLAVSRLSWKNITAATIAVANTGPDNAEESGSQHLASTGQIDKSKRCASRWRRWRRSHRRLRFAPGESTSIQEPRVGARLAPKLRARDASTVVTSALAGSRVLREKPPGETCARGFGSRSV
ncbi:hypothetical protein MTO96_005402 [Rhipicephalus appendiculatus]